MKKTVFWGICVVIALALLKFCIVENINDTQLVDSGIMVVLTISSFCLIFSIAKTLKQRKK